jgi:hypothetical protein
MKRATRTRNVASVLILALTFTLAGCGSSDTTSPGDNADKTELTKAEQSKTVEVDGTDAREQKRWDAGAKLVQAAKKLKPAAAAK